MKSVIWDRFEQFFSGSLVINLFLTRPPRFQFLSAQFSFLQIEVWLEKVTRRKKSSRSNQPWNNNLCLLCCEESLSSKIKHDCAAREQGCTDGGNGLFEITLCTFGLLTELLLPSESCSVRTRLPAALCLYCCFVAALIPPTPILPRSLYSVIKVILIQKLHFPHPSPIIIFEAYFKCRVINHVMVEVPLGLWACWEIFPFISSRLLFVSSHLKTASHKVNHLAFVVSTAGRSNLHNKLL